MVALFGGKTGNEFLIPSHTALMGKGPQYSTLCKTLSHIPDNHSGRPSSPCVNTIHISSFAREPSSALVFAKAVNGFLNAGLILAAPITLCVLCEEHFNCRGYAHSLFPSMVSFRVQFYTAPVCVCHDLVF